LQAGGRGKNILRRPARQKEAKGAEMGIIEKKKGKQRETEHIFGEEKEEKPGRTYRLVQDCAITNAEAPVAPWTHQKRKKRLHKSFPQGKKKRERGK